MAANYEQPDDAVTRVRFFDGQYLQDQDFIDDQHYHIDRQRRHQRLLHVAGIAEGLTVAPVAGTTQVEVAPGTAVDSDGRVIVLLEEPAPARMVSLADHLGRTVELFVVFQEVEASPQATGAADFGRWLEQPLLEVVDAGSAHDFVHPPVLLARIVLNNQTIEHIDTSPVAYSGLRLPGPGTDAATLRAVPNGNVELGATLGLTGLGVGTTDPAQAVTIVDSWNSGKMAENALTNGGALAIRSDAPQIDFVDVNGTDWAIHVNGNKMFFVREPWNFTDLVLDGGGNVGIGTSTPGSKLHVTGDTAVDGTLQFGKTIRQMLNLWGPNYGIGVQASTQYFRTDGNFAWYKGGAHHAGELNAGTGGTVQMVLKQGNLGVNVADPTARVHVGGDVTATGNLAVTGTGSFGGALSFGSTTRQMLNLWGTGYGIGVQASTQYFRSDGSFAWYQGGTHADAELTAGAGGTVQMTLKGSNLTVTGTVTATKVVGEGAFVTGMIIMWSGDVTRLPTGWALCTGGNGTPDLRDRFVVGAGSAYRPGDRGGSDASTLTVENMPRHDHGGSVLASGAHSHTVRGTDDGWAFGDAVRRGGTHAQTAGTVTVGGAGGHEHTIQPQGEGRPFDNRPQYFAVAFIMKL